ncbi:DUF456 domain-containing protein [bacterium]|nr:DUF456 domain-containing protein [bacterium]
MDILLSIIAFILLIVGILGCFLPALPGPPLSFAGMLLIHFTRFSQFEPSELVLAGAVVAAVQAIDAIIPVLGAKKFGGTRYGTRGSMIGLLVGLFLLPPLGPFGIVTILGGPFLGAYIGEKISGAGGEKALRAAFGTFIGFIAGTFMKTAVSITIVIVIIVNIIQNV